MEQKIDITEQVKYHASDILTNVMFNCKVLDMMMTNVIKTENGEESSVIKFNDIKSLATMIMEMNKLSMQFIESAMKSDDSKTDRRYITTVNSEDSTISNDEQTDDEWFTMDERKPPKGSTVTIEYGMTPECIEGVKYVCGNKWEVAQGVEVDIPINRWKYVGTPWLSLLISYQKLIPLYQLNTSEIVTHLVQQYDI